MKTGQFNVLQIKPVPIDGHLLRLDISAEEAKSKEFGFWVGFDTYEGALAGVQVGDRDLFGYGRPLTATIEVSQRSYRGEVLYEDPFFFDTAGRPGNVATAYRRSFGCLAQILLHQLFS
jgi:outer membrane protein assembly factor BamA